MVQDLQFEREENVNQDDTSFHLLDYLGGEKQKAFEGLETQVSNLTSNWAREVYFQYGHEYSKGIRVL